MIFIGMGCGAPQKEESNKETLKDLGEIMIDLKAYHLNIGDYLVRGKLHETEWLIDGMDSTLHLAIAKYAEHPKLSGSFESFYKELLEKPILEVKANVKANNKDAAIQSFVLLTDNCNSCHKKHEVRKRVKFNP
jgi:hypothetical protein